MINIRLVVKLKSWPAYMLVWRLLSESRTMQVLFLVILGAVASVHGHRYRGQRFIDLGIKGVLRPINAGSKQGAIRFDPFDRLTRTSLCCPTFVTNGFSEGLTKSRRSLNPLSDRCITEIRRTIVPKWCEIQSYSDICLSNELLTDWLSGHI